MVLQHPRPWQNVALAGAFTFHPQFLLPNLPLKPFNICQQFNQIRDGLETRLR